MIRCSCTQSYGLDKRELYAYVAGCPCYIWASTCVLGYLLHFRSKKTQASLCRLALAFVTNIHKVWIKIKTRNTIWTSSPTWCVKSLYWPTQRHLSRWHAPINKFRRVQSSNQIHGQWIWLVACWDIFYAFCRPLILPNLGPNSLLRLSAGGTCNQSVCVCAPARACVA